MHEKKEKGDLGVAFTIARLTELGYKISLPISEHSKYDLIMEKDNHCQTVQVRYTTPKNGYLEVKLRSCWADKNGTHTVERQKGDFDILAIFCPLNKDIYFIKDTDFDCKNTVVMRLDAPQSGVSKNTRMAENYRII